MPHSYHVKQKLLDHLHGIAEWKMPSQHFISLHSADPGDHGLNELKGGDYRRQSVSFTGTGESRINASPVTFKRLPQGAATHQGVWDAPLGGNLLHSGSLESPMSLLEGDGIKFDIGKIKTKF